VHREFFHLVSDLCSNTATEITEITRNLYTALPPGCAASVHLDGIVAHAHRLGNMDVLCPQQYDDIWVAPGRLYWVFPNWLLPDNIQEIGTIFAERPYHSVYIDLIATPLLYVACCLIHRSFPPAVHLVENRYNSEQSTSQSMQMGLCGAALVLDAIRRHFENVEDVSLIEVSTEDMEHYIH
jgi:hypothetical protein